MTVLQLILFAAGLLLALQAFSHPRAIAEYLDQIAAALSALSPHPVARRGVQPFTDRHVRAMALTFALLFTLVLCGLVTQLARGY